MSEQETLKVRINKVFSGTKEYQELYAKKLHKERNIILENYYDTYVESLSDKLDKYFVVTENEIFEIIEYNDLYSDDIFEAIINKDNSITCILSYYNGGCSFTEAVEEALKNLKE